MDYYYQNNNALSPAVNFYRPFPDTVIQTTSGSLPVDWYQTISRRTGTLTGYGAAISAKLMDELSVGLSGMYIKGSTDDFQSNVGRGKLIFLHYYSFWLDSANYVCTKQGTSDFKGAEFTISAIYKTQYFSVSGSLKPPTVITRDYSSTTTVDSTGAHIVTTASGSDKIKLPWRGTLGISIPVKKKFEVGLEYELRPYSSAIYTANDGSTSNPYKKCSVLRAGISYKANSWLTLRAGGRDQVEVSEFYGNPIVGDPIRSQIYSGGFGISYWGIHLNVTYEYHQLRYDDMLANTIYRNLQINRNVIADIVYDIPFFNK
jgi:opacity protein-like surface antigen